MTTEGPTGRAVDWVRAHASTLTLLAISLFVAFWQRPFEAFSDTRVELAADPALFLSKVVNLWNETYDLGSIQASQFVGYAFPMGPYFAVGDGLGIPIWILQRLWIGVLLFLAAYGTSRLIGSFFRSRRPGAGLIAGTLMIANPYVLVVLNRGSAWLLAYAALPWLLIWTQRGTREPNRWLYPAAFALTFAASGAGTNAAVAFWPLAASALLMVGYALFTSGRNAWTFAWKAALCSLPVALWWVVPVLAQVRFGTDYLTFTEHAETILNTSSASEALRLLGYWVGYINGYPEATPFIPSITSYLLSKPTVMVTLLIPAFAIASGALIRDRRPAIFFSALLAFGVIVMSLGFPQEGALGRVALDLYYDSGPLLFLRTTYKAAPLVALSISVLAGVGGAAALANVRSLRISIHGRPVGTAWIWAPLVGVLVVSVVLWGRPIFSGRAIDERLFFGAVPPAWAEALDDSQEKTPPDTRIAVLPGDLYGWYTWGGTLTSVAPGLSQRPVLVRQVLRAPPPNSAQLLESVDSAIQQDRLVPDQLPPLLRLMGVGRVLVGSDSSTLRGESIDAARASRVLAGQPGFERPSDRYGPGFVVEPPKDRGGGPVELSQVRAYDTPRPAQPRITRVQPAAEAQVIDGDANGIVALAAVGSLDPGKAIFYAGSLNNAQMNRVLRDSPTLTFTDSNRRRYVLGTRVSGNNGPALTAEKKIARIFPSYDPFPRWGSSAQTVAVYGGIREVTSPASPSFSLFPEHRPFAALDGDTATTWIAQSDDPAQRYVDVVLRRPTRVPEILLRPHMDQVAATRKVTISTDGDPETLHTVKSGWNRLPVSSAPVTRIRIRVIAKKTILGLSPAGIDEIRIPGVTTTEALRLPTLLASRTASADLSRIPLRVVLERATADFPRRSGIPTGPAFALDPADMQDAESGMRRIVTLPAQRTFAPNGWASVRPEAPDPILDALAGAPGGVRYASSSRFEGLPAFRASSAFDGNPRTGWAAEIGWRERPWVRVERDEPFTVSRLRLLPLPGRYLSPTRAQVGSPQGSFEVNVQEDGHIELPKPITTDSLTVRIIGVRRAVRTRNRRPVPRAIGIAEVQAPGLPRTPIPRRGRFTSDCGAATVTANGGRAELQVSGSVQDMDRGTALRFKACGDRNEIRLRKGANLITAPPGPVFATDFLKLQGDAPSASPKAAGRPSVSPSGEIELDGVGWLVLGQSYSPAWKARCRDSSGKERDMGAPTEIAGFANGWRIDGRTCRSASFSFGPQAGANIAYAISLAAALLLALVAFASWRRHRRHEQADPQSPTQEGQFELKIGAGDTLAELSASPGTEPRQHSGRLDIAGKALGLSSATLVVLTAVSYSLEAGTNDRGVNFEFANQHIVGHWLALAAMVALLGGSACRVVFELRRR